MSAWSFDQGNCESRVDGASPPKKPPGPAYGFEPVGVYRNIGWKFGAWHDVGWWQRLL